MQELIKNMDNWTLVKLLGGLTVIVSSVISLIAYLIKSYFTNRWITQQKIEIESLKAQFNQNNQILNNLTNSISNIYLDSNKKRVECLEKVWIGMMELKQNIPNLVFMAYSILKKDEIINLPKTTNEYTKASIESFKPQEYFDLSHKVLNEIQITRPFVGENIWIIFHVYSVFIGRLTYLIQDGLINGVVKYWGDDPEFFEQILKKVMTKEELKELTKNDFSSFNNVINFLEYKALNDISEQMSGKRMTNEAVKQAIELSKMTNTVA